jgi:hypothetical protein
MKRDLGNSIKCLSTIAPQTIGAGSTAASATGEGIDRLNYESVVFAFNNAAPAGTPTGVTITCKIQESDDNTTFTDISGATSSHNVTNTYSTTEVSVADATSLDRYVRGVATVTFNGGSGPYVTIGALAVLGSPKTYPV